MKPLPKTLRKDGFDFKQVVRDGNYAIYRQTKTSIPNWEAYEVIRIRQREASEIKGKTIEAHEAYPTSESWGLDGFTCDTLERAYAILGRMQRLDRDEKWLSLPPRQGLKGPSDAKTESQ